MRRRRNKTIRLAGPGAMSCRESEDYVCRGKNKRSVMTGPKPESFLEPRVGPELRSAIVVSYK